MFNTRGDREDSLSRSALEMIAAFEALLAFLVQPAASAVRCERAPTPFTGRLSDHSLCANASDTAANRGTIERPAPVIAFALAAHARDGQGPCMWWGPTVSVPMAFLRRQGSRVHVLLLFMLTHHATPTHNQLILQ